MDDLHTTVIANPGDVTPRTIQSMQSILDTMQKAISHTQAPHPELQAEIQQQYARIVPKVEATTTGNAGYSDAHSPKKQTNGHIEPNGSEITSHSTSVDCGQQALNNGDGQVAHETTNNKNAATADVQKPDETSENISKQIAESAVSEAGDRRTANRFPWKEDRSCLDARKGGSRDTV
ncbi:hypothetical protein E8E13_008884 [Curvularia kusanoi]|uniref:Uncharacterized protein n=1 Tax=Curvularia kusanoi TaxID=90978 RepID=A0A9P4TBZ1_CURKU|nr:hypothetical protein E8E13_008884 [Curvularia kusanoi]